MKRFNLLLSQSSVNLFVLDKNLIYKEFMGSESTFIDPDIFIGKSMFEIGMPDYFTKMTHEAMMMALKTGETQKIDYHLDHHGKRRWFSAKITASKNDKGEFDEFICFVFDITDKVETESKIKEQLNLIKTITDRIPGVIYQFELFHNGESKIAFVSSGIKKHLGIDAEDVKNDANLFFKYIHPDDRKMVFKSIQKSSMEFSLWNATFRVKLPDGRTLWLSGESLPMKTPDSTIWNGYLNDVTEKIQHKRQLQETELKFRNLLYNTKHIAIQGYDTNGTIIYWNKGSEFFYGYQENEVIHKNVSDILVSCNDIERVQKFFNRIKNGERVNQSGEWEHLSVDGRVIHVISSYFLHHRIDKSVEIYCIDVDISEIKDKNRELQHLVNITTSQNERLLNFAHIVSHNIRSHTSNLLGLTTVYEDLENDNEKEGFINLIHQTSQRLDETIHNLNEIISIQTQPNLKKTTVYLKEYVDSTIFSLSFIINKQQANINVNIDKDINIEVVPAYLDSILLNLITNAIRYAHPSRNIEINIYTEIKNGFLILTIQDNGLGIDLNRHKEKLFKMYKTFHDNPDARGLGLFLVKTQIEAMNGKIEVESEVNKGSKFMIHFELHNRS
jgi:PAS domain S-box-containing protein